MKKALNWFVEWLPAILAIAAIGGVFLVRIIEFNRLKAQVEQLKGEVSLLRTRLIQGG